MIDLYKVKNIYGVGIEQNRKKNVNLHSFIKNVTKIENTNIMMTSYVKKRPVLDEKAIWYNQLFVQIESDIGFQIKKENGDSLI